MDTREAVLVDAFAAEPTGGLPTVVLPDGEDLTDDQLAAAASEFAADAAVPIPGDGVPERLRVMAPDGSESGRVTPAIAALALANERGHVATGEYTLGTPAGTREATAAEDGRAWIAVDDAPATEADVALESVAEALGVDVAALRDVGSDLPPTHVAAGRDALAVAVNFLEHLSGARPDRDALADLAVGADVEAVCAYTFDTLHAGMACHLRTFVPGADRGPRASGLEVPVTPRLAAGCARYLANTGTVEGETLSVEQGHFLDRPATIDVGVVDGRVGGRAVTSLAGTVTLPQPGDGDDIIEV